MLKPALWRDLQPGSPGRIAWVAALLGAVLVPALTPSPAAAQVPPGVGPGVPTLVEPPAPETPPALLATFLRLDTAFAVGDVATLQALSTPRYWAGPDEGGRTLVRNAGRGAHLQTEPAQLAPGRAVLVCDFVLDGQVRDRVWTYWLEVDGAWLLDGFDEVKGHAPAFLRGEVGGHLYPDELPDLPELRAIGAELVYVAKGGATSHPAWPTSEAAERYTALLRAGTGPELVRTWAIPAAGRGLVCIRFADHEPVKFRVRAVERGWRIDGTGTGYKTCSATARDFFSAADR